MSRIVAQPCNLDDTPGINFNNTVDKKLQLSLTKDFLSESEYLALEKIYPDGTFRLWGVTPNNESRWNKISSGDVVLFHHAKEIFSTAKITYKIHNQELANNYWEPHTNNGPFEFLYFLNEFKYYNLPISGPDGYNRYYPTERTKKHIQRFNVWNYEEESQILIDKIYHKSEKNVAVDPISDYALYFNGVWEDVLDEIIIAQSNNPEIICFLQPAQPKYYSKLKSNPPSISSTVTGYFSTTTDLSTIAYKGLIVGWEDKQKLSEKRVKEFSDNIEKYQPGEKDRFERDGEAVNLLSIKNLVKLEVPFHINNLVKTSDKEPLKVKHRGGGHSYVNELPADFVAEQSNVFVPIDFGQGKKYLRKDIIDTYGGQSRSGITTPSNHPIIFLFTSKVGEQFGYDDGWTDDGTFEICGEGQVGDMEFVRGNKAVLEHLENGKELHLFEAVGGGYVRYISEMFYKSHREDIGPDKNGADRKRILFELTPFEIKTESPEQKQERNKASITGDKAEGIFEDNALKFYGWKVINKTDKQNLGYDFLCEDPELFIEVKGCLDGVSSIRLTEREWEIAKEKKEQYVLVIVSKIDDKYERAEIVKFEDPYSSFNSVIKEQIVKVKSLHINGRDLRELVE